MSQQLPALCRVCGAIHSEDWEADHEPLPLVCSACGADLVLFLPSYDGERQYYCQSCEHEHTWHTEVFKVGRRLRVLTTCLNCGAER